ncbi:hypothetical protein DES53_10390 [Roseimicrobium gellanilyticum]|uniref:Uncharacterized protein n=1 Tax=Roseimicrobium gellanilyticum TaxID=748857 RepID=A0A366HPQ4_9BACT|nr:hypothetical protein [Roseimicrobium gellanilyticum]RBP45094.1 hypothetical protein DES53_10390 [Roseimicrobium gellanilyticum]
MGLEYKIETYDRARTEWQKLLQHRQEFLYEEEGTYHLGLSREHLFISVKEEAEYIYLCQHVACTESDALMGLLIRRLLSLNDHLVISEL